METAALAGTWGGAILGVVGLLLLIAGRRLFWLAVTAAGFLLGAGLAETLMPAASGPGRLGLLLGGGVAGAALALLLPRAGAALAGGALGAAAVWALLPAAGWQLEGWPLLALLVAAAGISALLALRLLALALGVLSAGIGAALLVAVLPWSPPVELVLFLALWLTGAAYQGTR